MFEIKGSRSRLLKTDHLPRQSQDEHRENVLKQTVVFVVCTVQNDSWGGVFLITSDCAVGCPWRKHGVVIGCGGDAAHTSGADPQVSELTSIWSPLQRALR